MSENDKTENQGSNIVKYGAYTPEAARHEAEEVSRMVKTTFMDWKVGRNIVRILPPPAGRNSPFVFLATHYIDAPGAEKKVVFNCPRLMAKKPCVACAVAERLRSGGNYADAKAAENFEPGFAVITALVDRARPELGPMLARFSKKQHEKLRFLREDPEAGVDYTDPIDGHDIVVTRTGTGKKDTRYEVAVSRKSTPLGDMGWLDMRPSLGRTVYVPTPEEIREMLESGNLGDVVRTVSGKGAPSAGEGRRLKAVDAPVIDPDDDIAW